MIQIEIPASEYYDADKNEFFTTKKQILTLEHSLVAISKWESKWKKPFLSKKIDRSVEEQLDYIRCMTITQNVDPMVYYAIDIDSINKIKDYIEDPMTATWFSNVNEKPSREIITSELIYYWMVALNIPFECQKWHLNRLLTLIRVCNVKEAPPTKMSRREIMSRNAALNAARRKKFSTKG